VLVGEPMTVGSDGRLYTDGRQRSRIDVTGRRGQGTDVDVGLVVVQRDTEWDGLSMEAVTFTTTIGTRGEIRIPVPIREELSLERGDGVRVTLRRA